MTGLPAWKRGQPGQVGNEAAPTVVTSAGVRLVTPNSRCMIVHLAINMTGPDAFDYAVRSEGQDLYADTGLSSIIHCLAAAIEGLDPEVRAADFAFQGIVSGTYPLRVLATRPAEVAQHAVNTTAAVLEAEND